MAMRVFKCGSKNQKGETSAARRFAREEDGGVFTIFVLIGFLLIMATAGIGVDIMNFERDRTSLQATLDRAVLAAANVKQDLPPKEVVKSYIEKSDVRGELTGEPIVLEGIGSRKVTANASVDVDMHFLSYFGYPKLTAAAASVAEEAIGSIEIAMVLDISGSMNWNSATANKKKIAALREAAVKFVNTIYKEEDPDKISIAIIPYNNQVNASANILDKMSGVTREHTFSNCVNFKPSQFGEVALDPTKPLNRTAHFDRRNYGDNYSSELHRSSVCTTRAGSAITPVTNVIADLHKQINAMTPGGNTSIDIGVKWGAAFLDPSFQPVIAQLANQNFDPNVNVDPDTGFIVGTSQEPKKVVPPVFSNRPAAYDTNVKKIMVVMTDGENTENWILDDDLRDGASDVWFNSDPIIGEVCTYYPGWGTWCRDEVIHDNEYSVRTSTDPDLYYWTRQELEDQTEPYGGADKNTRLTYPQLWNRVNLDWNARYNYAWQDNNNTNWYSRAFTTTSRTTKDTRLKNICGKLKAKNVDIYGIAFEAPDVGVKAIKNCSSGDGFFFPVNAGGTLGSENLTLEQVFQTIAVSIKRLRLTQ
ncbi:TadE/TadG family type IV pilus assembly protein [Ruegeria sp. R14_0]|uniref:TadE/TadG family type IV pilus assembly protein n=1 Tax=Ruegeria sp. R14_0 TaxID=2821100 RepID=UPI001ADAEAD0|nr:TadE/TadG family type IV pilus assembly protein [Ruegeria sp. R14_0]MBO9446284.1 Tad domain-containing protein [Ruegeria sp. R14_0]